MTEVRLANRMMRVLQGYAFAPYVVVRNHAPVGQMMVVSMAVSMMAVSMMAVSVASIVGIGNSWDWQGC
jgi:hypothetical protein